VSSPPLELEAVLKVPALLSVASTARLLDCSPRTVRRRIAAGELPAVLDHGRLMVRGDELAAYINRLERPGSRPRRRQSRQAGGEFGWLRRDS
jgi:excisionase family DNA binding protein